MILDRIVAVKREEVAFAKQMIPQGQLERQITTVANTRDFKSALKRQRGAVRLIAEVKKASPSKGLIRSDFAPLAIAQTYASNGAAAISVLTDKNFFQGDPEYLRQIRQMVALPLLRKDFVIDPYQIYEARVWGADAILLIVACLEQSQLREYQALSRQLGLAALVEVHTAKELLIALSTEAEIIGINNRNLRTFETSLQTTLALRAEIPTDRVVVSESGIRDARDVSLLAEHGVDAILVGESLMRSADIGVAMQELLSGMVNA